jgi:predicted transposase YbfD/YdcC
LKHTKKASILFVATKNKKGLFLMSNRTFHTIRLQDGTLCNINKRVAKQAVPLRDFLGAIPDARHAQGRRHGLVLILLIVFVALLRNSKDLKDACLFAGTNRRLFKRMELPLTHGVPDPTTVSRALRALDPEALVSAFTGFMRAIGVSLGDVLSFDGKTMRAVTGEDTVRHMLSLFSHETHLAVGQIGVDGKENEIPAFERLLVQGTAHDTVAGKLLLGDALHTQRATVRTVLSAGADYLFVVKGNQKGLRRAIQTGLVAAQEPNSYSYEAVDRKRSVTTTVTVMTAPSGEELALPTGNQHWAGVRTAGILHRTGTRTSKDGKVTPVDETIGVICSRIMSAEEVAGHLRRHWCIENNLHWVKDEVFKEDKHTLRRGNAPQIMSLLRSMVISLCNALKLKSISDTIHNLEKSSSLLGRFLKMAAVI